MTDTIFSKRLGKRSFLKAILATSVAAVSLAPASLLAQSATKEFRIGYQKNGVLYLAKQTGQIDAAFKAKGIDVKWVEFSFGPPLLEALNIGSIDFGYTGDSPPIFAQAAGANILYVAAQEAAGAGAAILVKDDSPIKTLADLKGKKLGFAKASSAHNLSIAALEKAGLTYQDITPVYLPPADGAAAFSKGAIDAWTIWDPFYAVAEAQPGTRVLALAQGIVRQNSFFLANKTFTEAHPELVSLANAEIARASQWATAHREEVTKILTEATGIAYDAQKKAVDRTEFVITPLSPPVVDEQQHIADRFLALGLIPKPIAVKDVVWVWKPTT